MTIHTVQKGEIIQSIAEKYNLPASRLERDNDLAPNTMLSEGEALMILNPVETYVVKAGDTFDSIEKAFNITHIEMLRNNPQLSGRTALTGGEELVIRYNNKEKQIYVNGFANSFINTSVLIKTLPYLTYITILNYKVTADGSLINIPDEKVIRISRSFGVAPLMFISAFDIYGVEETEAIHIILVDPKVQAKLISNILDMLESKNYYGLYLGFESVLRSDLPLYTDFVRSVTDRVNKSGYEVFISLLPSTFGYIQGGTINGPYFAKIGRTVNYATLLTYQWMTSTISQFADTGASFMDAYVSYAVTLIPPEKLYLGLDRIAYDWQYPYSERNKSGYFLSDFAAVNLANQYAAAIHLDPPTQAPFFYYNDVAGLQHFVWYKDARTGVALLDIIFKYGLRGVALWNVMYYYASAFTALNYEYDIVSILNPTAAKPP